MTSQAAYRERITFRDPNTGKQKREWAQILSEGPTVILYRPLDSRGEDRSHYNAKGVLIDVQRMLATSLIVSRQPARQNPTYGTMEICS